MKLYIDTSSREKLIIKLDNKEFEETALDKKSQKLLPFLMQILKENNKKVEDISEIEVNKGPGSFTGLRVGLSVANALGYALDIPVNGSDIKKTGPLEPVYE